MRGKVTTWDKYMRFPLVPFLIEARPRFIKFIWATFSPDRRNRWISAKPGWTHLSANSRVPTNSAAPTRLTRPITTLEQTSRRKCIKTRRAIGPGSDFHGLDLPKSPQRLGCSELSPRNQTRWNRLTQLKALVANGHTRRALSSS